MALIVFDIDGTLFRTDQVTAPAVMDAFAEAGLKVPDAEMIRGFFGRSVAEYEAWLEAQCPAKLAEAIIAAANARELAYIGSRGKLYPGVQEMLKALTDAGHVLAVCSNGPENYVAEVLDAHDLRKWFAGVRARGHRTEEKAVLTGELLDACAARPLIVVGDRHDDVASAHAHGGWAIGAGYGFGNADELAGADILVNAATEVPGAVQALLAR